VITEGARPEPGPSPLIRWLSQSEQGVWRSLLSVQRRLEDRLDQDLRAAHGLSLNDYEVLVHLSEAAQHALRMSDLADRLLLSRSGLTRRIDGLVREGLVERRVCPSDGRGLLAQLTPAGSERLRQAAPTHVGGVRRYLIDVIGCGRLDGVAHGVGEIERALDEAD
jgi:DNA-binding MarR family transcriptional regulator